MNQHSPASKRLELAAISITLICGLMTPFSLAILSFVSAGPVKAASTADPNHGKELFEKRCGGCHALDSDKEGPRLRNVYGRRSGTIPTFKYSPALKSGTVQWDANSLDKWLTDTESVIPDNEMDFHVPRSDERADIIEYLRITAGK